MKSYSDIYILKKIRYNLVFKSKAFEAWETLSQRLFSTIYYLCGPNISLLFLYL